MDENYWIMYKDEKFEKFVGIGRGICVHHIYSLL